MSSAAFQQIVRDRMEAWTGAPVRWDRNASFAPPAGPWVDMAFPGMGQARGDIGAASPIYDEAGAFMVHVYVPAGAGDMLAAQIADSIADHFLRWADPPEGVTITERMQGQYGPRDFERDSDIKGRWWGVSFGIGYTYQTIG